MSPASSEDLHSHIHSQPNPALPFSIFDAIKKITDVEWKWSWLQAKVNKKLLKYTTVKNKLQLISPDSYSRKIWLWLENLTNIDLQIKIVPSRSSFGEVAMKVIALQMKSSGIQNLVLSFSIWSLLGKKFCSMLFLSPRDKPGLWQLNTSISSWLGGRGTSGSKPCYKLACCEYTG